MESPDTHSSGFLEVAPDAMRYEHVSLDPDDVGLKLSNLIAPNSKVLDVGCGTGVITEIIQRERNASIIGIEPDEERASRASARGMKVFNAFLSSEFLSHHGPFDSIVFADVLEHLPNPAELLAMSRKGLKPGGSIVVSVPNIAHWFVRVDLLFGRFDYQDCGIMDATHLRWFTRRTIRELFERQGFEITAFDCTVNIDLPDYNRRMPWRKMSPAFRRKLVGRLAAWRPALFGCQHIVRATLKE